MQKESSTVKLKINW